MITHCTILHHFRLIFVNFLDFENDIKFLVHFKWIYTTDNISMERILNPILTKTKEEEEEGTFLTYKGNKTNILNLYTSYLILVIIRNSLFKTKMAINLKNSL